MGDFIVVNDGILTVMVSYAVDGFISDFVICSVKLIRSNMIISICGIESQV